MNRKQVKSKDGGKMTKTFLMYMTPKEFDSLTKLAQDEGISKNGFLKRALK